jgi:hypothetical protein
MSLLVGREEAGDGRLRKAGGRPSQAARADHGAGEVGPGWCLMV